jgi:plastocyanin
LQILDTSSSHHVNNRQASSPQLQFDPFIPPEAIMLARALLLALLPFAYGQAYGGGAASSSTSMSSSTAATPAATSSGVHSVDVGKDGLVFTPNTVMAAVGDKIQFYYFPQSHSVVESAFSSPCSPLSNGIYSGLVPVSSGESVS